MKPGLHGTKLMPGFFLSILNPNPTLAASTWIQLEPTHCLELQTHWVHTTSCHRVKMVVPPRPLVGFWGSDYGAETFSYKSESLDSSCSTAQGESHFFLSNKRQCMRRPGRQRGEGLVGRKLNGSSHNG